MVAQHENIVSVRTHFVPSHRRRLRREFVRGGSGYSRLKSAKLDKGFSVENNIYPSLYHSWPKQSGRIDKTVNALKRLACRREFHLPARKDYQSMVDFYEAALPVIKAIHYTDCQRKASKITPSLTIGGILQNIRQFLFL